MIETGVFTVHPGGAGEWEPAVRPGDSLDDVPLNEWVGQAVGAASACWENLSGAGVFKSARAKIIVDSLNAHIQKVIDGVIAGTTRAVTTGAVGCTGVHAEPDSRFALHQEAATKAVENMRRAEAVMDDDGRLRHLSLAAGWAAVARGLR